MYGIIMIVGFTAVCWVRSRVAPFAVSSFDPTLSHYPLDDVFL